MPTVTRSIPHGDRWITTLLLTCLAYLCWAGNAFALAISVLPTQALQQVIDQAPSGATLVLQPGEYAGNIHINKPLTLTSAPPQSAHLIGERQGRTIWVSAENVAIRDVLVSHSGLDLAAMDAGIFLDRTAHHAAITNNIIFDNSVGVYVRGPQQALVDGNQIIGNHTIRMSERGNGITLWNSPYTTISNNRIQYGRDGIYAHTSHHNTFINNQFSQLRYGVHYMYTNDSVVAGNTAVDNDIGFAIMFSDRIHIHGNLAVRSVEQGFNLNAANDSTLRNNVIYGGQKCVFFYNANHNQFTHNHFEGCDIGIHFTAGSEQNVISENAFVRNHNQVKYVSTRYVDWSHQGRGNYWSDNSAFDLNGDGIADASYRPNDIIDQLLWRAPNAQMLLNSPAVSIVRWAQKQFPSIMPGGVVDSAPLMQPTPIPTLDRLKALL